MCRFAPVAPEAISQVTCPILLPTHQSAAILSLPTFSPRPCERRSFQLVTLAHGLVQGEHAAGAAIVRGWSIECPGMIFCITFMVGQVDGEHHGPLHARWGGGRLHAPGHVSPGPASPVPLLWSTHLLWPPVDHPRLVSLGLSLSACPSRLVPLGWAGDMVLLGRGPPGHVAGF